MNKAQIRKLREINAKIIQCDYCDFHRSLPKNYYFKPDAPIYENKFYRNDYRVLTIGIHPTLRREYGYKEWQTIAQHDPKDYDGYAKKLLEQVRTNGVKNSSYMRELIKYFNLLILGLREMGLSRKIRAQLNLPTEVEINIKNFDEYLYWTNLSFCASQKPDERKLRLNGNNRYNHTLCSNTYSEEIPNCLKKGYLKDIIKTIRPRLLVVYSAFPYYKALLQDLLKVGYIDVHSNGPIVVKAYKCDKINIMTSFYCAKVTNILDNRDDIYAIFLNHPNARISDDGRKEAIKEICSRLYRYGILD